jgi:hypothetical protein
MYILQTRWSWGHAHTDYCTFSLEDETEDAASLDFASLFEPDIDPSGLTYQTLMGMIQEVCDAQNGNLMADNCKPVAIYRVLAFGRPVFDEEHAPSRGTLTFSLELVGKFDQQGRPMAKMP